MIREFQGRYRFLSNFWKCRVEYEGRIWPSSEHAFQAAKCLREQDKQEIFGMLKPGDAKRFGRLVRKRSDWEDEKVSVMYEILRKKFQDSLLRSWLLSTGNKTLQEGNNWGDTFWGVDLKTGCGENHLGKLLMKVREELR